MIGEFLSAAGGALLGLGSGMALEWWKSERSEITTLCSEFCDLIAEAADAGAEFWLTPASDERAHFLFARIAGFQNRISGYNIILAGRIAADSEDDIRDNLAALFRSLSGGDPDDPQRIASMPQALTVHDDASDAIIAVRQAAYQRLSFYETISGRISASWPNAPVGPAPRRPFKGGENI